MIDASSSLHSSSKHLSLHSFSQPPHQSQMGDVLLPFPSALSTTVCLTSFPVQLNPLSLSSSPPTNPLALSSVYPLKQASSVLDIKQSKQKALAKPLH